jgi:hypothetical protein
MGAGALRGKQVGGDRAGKRQTVGGARLWSKQAGGKLAGGKSILLVTYKTLAAERHQALLDSSIFHTVKKLWN